MNEVNQNIMINAPPSKDEGKGKYEEMCEMSLSMGMKRNWTHFFLYSFLVELSKYRL